MHFMQESFNLQVSEFMLFAILMLLDMLGLALLAKRYTYVDYSGEEEDIQKPIEKLEERIEENLDEKH